MTRPPMMASMPFERIAFDPDTYLADVRMFGRRRLRDALERR